MAAPDESTDDFSFAAETFSGTVRLFPLPHLVLFPHVMQPLHIFEPRYCAMLQEAMATDRLIAIATLAPGWESDYEGRPPLAPIGCLGRVAAHRQLDDGAHNILLSGLKRVRLVRELPPTKQFREAEVEIREDLYPPGERETGLRLRRKLRDAFLLILASLPPAHEQLDNLVGGEMPLEVMTDIISYMLDIPLADKQQLLAEMNVYRRAELLLVHLAAAAGDSSPGKAGVGDFPPGFSAN